MSPTSKKLKGKQPCVSKQASLYVVPVNVCEGTSSAIKKTE